MKRKIEI